MVYQTTAVENDRRYELTYSDTVILKYFYTLIYINKSIIYSTNGTYLTISCRNSMYNFFSFVTIYHTYIHAYTHT